MSAIKPFEITGVLVSVGDEQQKTDRFKIREFVIDAGDEKYPNNLIFQLNNDNTGCINPYGVGERLVVSFYLRGWAKGCNLICASIQASESAERNYKPRKEKEPELPLPNEPHYLNEVIPTGRKRENQPAKDNEEEVSDLPF
jgi:hypothetical protein